MWCSARPVRDRQFEAELGATSMRTRVGGGSVDTLWTTRGRSLVSVEQRRCQTMYVDAADEAVRGVDDRSEAIFRGHFCFLNLDGKLKKSSEG